DFATMNDTGRFVHATAAGVTALRIAAAAATATAASKCSAGDDRCDLRTLREGGDDEGNVFRKADFRCLGNVDAERDSRLRDGEGFGQREQHAVRLALRAVALADDLRELPESIAGDLQLRHVARIVDLCDGLRVLLLQRGFLIVELLLDRYLVE